MLKSSDVGSVLDHLVALKAAGVIRLFGSGPRLYYRRIGEAFAQVRSVEGALVTAGAAVILTFELPTATVDCLRFDLPAVAGCYRMGPVAIDGCEVENLSRRVMAVHGRRLPDPDSASEIRLAEWTGAPYFELDVRGLLNGDRSIDSAVVRVTARTEHAAIEMERQLDLATAELGRHLKEHAEAIGGSVAEAVGSLALAQRSAENRLCQALVEMSARVDHLHADASCWLADVGAKVDGAASASAERLDDRVREVSASMAIQAETFRQEVAALRQSLDDMRGQVDFLLRYELNRSLVRRALRKVKRWVWK